MLSEILLESFSKGTHFFNIKSCFKETDKKPRRGHVERMSPGLLSANKNVYPLKQIVTNFFKLMLKNVLLALTAFLFFQKTTAQSLIPFLAKTGKYGFANDRGEVLIQPNFEGYLPFWPVQFLSINSRQNDQPVSLLRNGMAIPGESLMGIPVVNYADGKYEKPDTLYDLVLLKNGKKWVFVDLKTRQTNEFPFIENYQNPNWFSLVGRNYHSLECAFDFGFCRVYKENGRINFIGTDLKEVFPKDFLAGAIGGPGLFVVGNESQKMGIVDQTGKIRTPFVWERIDLPTRPGYFLVNNETNSFSKKPHRAGMIDADGKIIIDTIYKYITGGKDYLAVHGKDRVGLMDYTGKWVFPLEYRDISSFFGEFFIVKPVGGMANVVNLKGEKQFKKDFNEIEPRTFRYGQKPFLLLRDGELLGLADSTFRVLFWDTLTSIAETQQTTFTKKAHHFLVLEGRSNYANDRYGIRDTSGKRILPGIFNRISHMQHFGDDAYLVKKDSLWGVFDTEGKVIFPVHFLEITVGPHPENDRIPVIWARAVGEFQYSAYDKNGQKLPSAPRFEPWQNKVFRIETLDREKPSVLVFIDGSRRIIDASEAEKLARFWHVPTPDGGFILEESGDQIKVSDAFLKNIVPDGFSVPKKTFEHDRLAATGLLTVYQAQSSGVINAKGAWAMPPKTGTKFIPLSRYLVMEADLKADQSGRNKRESFTVHRINSKQKPIEVNLVGQRGFSANNNFTMLLGNLSRGGDRILAAYFDHTGEQLTEFNIVDGVDYLQKSNLVTIMGKGGVRTNQILDEKGKLIADLGDITARPHRGNEWAVKYYVAQKRGSEDYGLIDSTGKVLLPFQFKDLKIIASGKLLSCQNISGGTDLMDIRGEVLFSTPKKVSFHSRETKNGFLLAGTDDETAVVSPEGKLARILPYKFEDLSQSPDYPNLAKFLDKVTYKTFWVNVETGLEFRE